jgi:hypothetical protein
VVPTQSKIVCFIISQPIKMLGSIILNMAISSLVLYRWPIMIRPISMT